MEIKSLEERMKEIFSYLERCRNRKLKAKKGKINFCMLEKVNECGVVGGYGFQDVDKGFGTPIFFHDTIFDVMERLEPLFCDEAALEPRSCSKVPDNVKYFYYLFMEACNKMPKKHGASIWNKKHYFYEKTGIYGSITLNAPGGIYINEIIDKDYPVERMVELSKIVLIPDEEIDNEMDMIFEYIESIKARKFKFEGTFTYERFERTHFDSVAGYYTITYPEHICMPNRTEKRTIELRDKFKYVKQYLEYQLIKEDSVKSEELYEGKIGKNNNIQLF